MNIETNHPYIYIFTRNDLSIPQRAVQSCHAAIEATREFLRANDEHPYIVLCSTKNQNSLMKIVKTLYEQNIRLKVFREPDIGNELTSIATQPLYGEQRKAMTKYQLMK